MSWSVGFMLPVLHVVSRFELASLLAQACSHGTATGKGIASSETFIFEGLDT